MSDDTNGPAAPLPPEDAATVDRLLGEVFDSPAAADLVARCLRVALNAPAADVADTRAESMRELLEGVRPEVRTRAALLADVLTDCAKWIRRETLAVKIEREDPDVVGGEANITDDGWLVVTMNGAEIGRVPFDPHRDDGSEQALAEDILSEYQRLHVLGDRYKRDLLELPKAGRRRIIGVVMRDDVEGGE